MNRNEESVIKRLMRIIDSKTSWGKNELKSVITDLVVDELSQVRTANITTAPSKPKQHGPTPDLRPRKISIDELPPF